MVIQNISEMKHFEKNRNNLFKNDKSLDRLNLKQEKTQIETSEKIFRYGNC